jgi:hypothetical protein
MRSLLTHRFLTRVIIILVSFFPPTLIFSQNADLVVTNASCNSYTVARGDVLNMNLLVRNSGSKAAGQSYLFYYLSTDSIFTENEIQGRVSVKPLGAGQSENISIEYQLPHRTPAGSYYIGYQLDISNQVLENQENNYFHDVVKLNVLSTLNRNLKLPYPVIFVHGLVGSKNTWNEIISDMVNIQGLSYGGWMDFCLNYDNSLTSSNLANDIKEFTKPNNFVKGDLYTINFAVTPSGQDYNDNWTLSYTNQSNQAAIVKQGRALGEAIKNVLQITGRDKVILVGHSMGGLAAREYLQNSGHYQEDSSHHVAKLLTIGTPHLGSNMSSPILSYFQGVDELSDGVRDLRSNYSNGKKGCYLFGGIENSNHVYGDGIPFKHLDVNCNGMIGESIVGLNQKSIPEDLAFSCIIGAGSLLGGDGVVSEVSANINSYKANLADTFRIIQVSGELALHHTQFHKELANVMKGLDEANDTVAYEIELNRHYVGFSNIQSKTGYTLDFDTYKFQVDQPGLLNVNISSIPVASLFVTLYNSIGDEIGSVGSNGASNISIERQVNPGIYYLDFESQWTTLSYKYPYSFKVNQTPLVSVEEMVLQDTSVLYPNPANDEANIHIQLRQSETIDLLIFDLSGRVIGESKHYCQGGENLIKVDLHNLSAGVYALTLRKDKVVNTHRLIVVK